MNEKVKSQKKKKNKNHEMCTFEMGSHLQRFPFKKLFKIDIVGPSKNNNTGLLTTISNQIFFIV